MVAAIENLTRLTARLVDRQPHPALPGWDLVRIELLGAEAVPGKADLLSPHLGTELDVAVPRALVGEGVVGWELRFRARLTTNGVVAERDPPPGEFVALPPTA